MIKFYTVSPDHDHLGGARQATKVSIALQEIGEPFETIDLNRRKVVRPKDSWFARSTPTDECRRSTTTALFSGNARQFSNTLSSLAKARGLCFRAISRNEPLY